MKRRDEDTVPDRDGPGKVQAGLEFFCHKPGSVWSFRKLEEVRRAPVPEASGELQFCRHPHFSLLVSRPVRE